MLWDPSTSTKHSQTRMSMRALGAFVSGHTSRFAFSPALSLGSILIQGLATSRCYLSLESFHLKA